MTKRYIVINNCSIGFPKDSEIELYDRKDDYISIIYKNMWFGYYHISNFKLL